MSSSQIKLRYAQFLTIQFRLRNYQNIRRTMSPWQETIPLLVSWWLSTGRFPTISSPVTSPLACLSSSAGSAFSFRQMLFQEGQRIYYIIERIICLLHILFNKKTYFGVHLQFYLTRAYFQYNDPAYHCIPCPCEHLQYHHYKHPQGRRTHSYRGLGHWMCSFCLWGIDR